jgi:hypothetical protein
VDWIGCSLHDLIQPSFSFMVGVALPFSIVAQCELSQLSKMLYEFQRTDLLHTIRAPTLILVGDQDVATPPAVVKSAMDQKVVDRARVSTPSVNTCVVKSEKTAPPIAFRSISWPLSCVTTVPSGENRIVKDVKSANCGAVPAMFWNLSVARSTN